MPNSKTRGHSMAITKRIVVMGLMIAMEIVLSRFLSISTPLLKIGFSFIPIVVVAIAYGPIYAGIVGGLGDLIGALAFPIGPYFPGFTLSAFITGLIFGLCLYNRKIEQWKKPEGEKPPFSAYVKQFCRLLAKCWWRVILGPLVVAIIVSLILDPIWLKVLYGKAFWALIPTRLIKAAVMVPLQSIITVVLCYPVALMLKK